MNISTLFNVSTVDFIVFRQILVKVCFQCDACEKLCFFSDSDHCCSISQLTCEVDVTGCMFDVAVNGTEGFRFDSRTS